MERLVARELDGRTFACLEGCGFCCTFQPEVSQRELALLRARMKPRPVPFAVGDGRSYLALQNKCGACTLLERRACQAYDLRPAHCRYFPFHVHFGRAPEALVNFTCRGVERAPGDLRAAFQGAVVASSKPEEWADHERGAREAYAAFERNAKRAGAWGEVAPVVEEALAEPVTRAWMERALERAAEDLTPDELVADALAAFAVEDVTKRPFYLPPDLRWLTFEGATRVVEMDEQGALHPVRDLAPLAGWRDPTVDLRPYLRDLTARGVFEGSVFDVVDEMRYETTVAEATWWRLAQIAADLVAREHVLRELGVGEERLLEELARFYDSTFLDSPTIGGFL